MENYVKYEKKLTSISDKILNSQNLEKGISIIIPLYDGINYLNDCLGSISSQNIKDAKFEVILVLNGIFKKELEYLNTNIYENLDILLLINDKASAGAARNLGMKSAKYSHITFVDVDDYLSANYVQSHYDLLDSNTITISQIYDVKDGVIIEDNPINLEVIENEKPASVSILKLNRISSITACKVIPKEIALLQEFRSYLRSGEDTVFYSELYVNSRPRLKVIPIKEDSIYFRRIRENSVSRKANSYDFSVSQRLEILEILDDLLNQINNPTLIKFVKSKYNAQISFMNRFLTENPQEYNTIIQSIESMSFNYFNFSKLNNGLSKLLVLSYCFPPYSDTSATIVAKRLIERNEVFDVISNNMSKIRHKEQSLNNLILPLIDKRITLNHQPSFSSMYYLNKYIDTAVTAFINNKKKYDTVYSRAMFPISHIPGLFIKILKSDIEWIAEFSDPLLYDIDSNIRYSEMKNDGLVKALKNGILGIFGSYVDDNLFNLAELIPFALADKIIFTNENQQEYMISRFNDSEKTYIRKKSVISEHPTLSHQYYNIQTTSLNVDPSIVNIAYFGNFYNRRNYHQFINLVERFNNQFKLIFKLHIYTNVKYLNDNELKELEDNNVVINSYLSYTEFLNASTKYDLLIISDAETKNNKPFNPYLPSKLSDYLGSGTPILALTENFSAMSQINDNYLFKVDLEILNEKNIDENAEIIKLVNFLRNEKKKKRRRLSYCNDGIINLHEDYKLMEISNDLAVLNLGFKDWLTYPKKLPILQQNDYSIKLYNNTSTIKKYELLSYYSVPKVIEVEIIECGTLKETICISELKNTTKTFEIPENGNVSINLKYLKEYNKTGFIKAGRLRIKGI